MIERLERIPRKLTAAGLAAMGMLGLGACSGEGDVSAAQWDVKVICPDPTDRLNVVSVTNQEYHLRESTVKVTCDDTVPKSMEVINGPNAAKINIDVDGDTQPNTHTIRVEATYDNGGMDYNFSPPFVNTSASDGTIDVKYDGSYNSDSEDDVITSVTVK